MIIYHETRCPKCGGHLKYYNTVKRIIKNKGGKNEHIYLRQFICDKCSSIHRELPNNLLPYKHYNAEIIEGVVSNKITSDDICYEDFPSEITMKRWKSSPEIHLLLRRRKMTSERRNNIMKKKYGETTICPYCGGIATYHSQVKRTVKSKCGEVEEIKVKTFKCSHCGKMHRDLPDYLTPHKQYRNDIIDGFINDLLSKKDLEYEDYPSENTIRRWKQEREKKQ